MSLAHLLQRPSPNLAVITATAGLCLGFVEFNRPGRILPGALGLLLILLAAANLLRAGLRPCAGILLLAAAAVFLLNLRRRVPFLYLAMSTAAAGVSLFFLVLPSGSRPVHPVTAILCATLLGVLSGTLTRIAYRARRSKALD